MIAATWSERSYIPRMCKGHPLIFALFLYFSFFLNPVCFSRLKELELIKQELEQLLEEEKQAKRDEELVRTIQARMLTEEWER